MRWLSLLSLPLLLLAGCGGEPYKVAPVSGRVTLNGQPLANASVTFSPVATGGNLEPGPGSYATTDTDGRYTLKIIGKESRGAVVGKHKVRIALVEQERDPSDDRPKRTTVKQLPEKYNAKTTLEVDVPDKGTDSADFQLTVP
jgi:hypothetical protein